MTDIEKAQAYIADHALVWQGNLWDTVVGMKRAGVPVIDRPAILSILTPKEAS